MQIDDWLEPYRRTWEARLDDLARLLDTGSAPYVADADTSALEARHAEAVSATASP